MSCGGLGWRNRATWAAAAWLGNNGEVLEEALLRINGAEHPAGRPIALKEVVCEWFSEAVDEVTTGEGGNQLMVALANTGLANVDWEELVDHVGRLVDGGIEEDEL